MEILILMTLVTEAVPAMKGKFMEFWHQWLVMLPARSLPSHSSPLFTTAHLILVKENCS